MAEKIVWVAAYPKTGSTWLRSILQQVLAPRMRAKDAIVSFDKDYPVDAPEHHVMSTNAKVLRTHTHPQHKVFQTLQEQWPHRPVGVITIQRHPLDVLLSQINYAFILGREASFKDGLVKRAEDIIADGEIDHYIDAFIESDGCPEYAKRCRSYGGFYDAWRQLASGTEHLHLRYETMVEEREAAIERVARYLRLDGVDAHLIMCRVEERTKADGRFYWRKRRYGFRDLLPASSVRRFEQGFAATLRQLGYSLHAYILIPIVLANPF